MHIAKKNGCYTITHSHSTGESFSLYTLLYRIYSYKTRYIADYFFGCSKEAIQSRYGKKVLYDETISSLFKNAIDTKLFKFDADVRNSKRKELRIPNDKFVIGTVGRLTTPKNPIGIIKIIKSISSFDNDFIFIWMGVGELEDEIKNRIRDEGLEENIMMLGLRTDVDEMLQVLDAFIFPSLWEGLGIVAIEAQAAGLPTYCSDTIPREAKVTDLCMFLPLNSEGEWAKTILSKRDYERYNTSEMIRKKGYDIVENAKWIQKFYLEKYELIC